MTLNNIRAYLAAVSLLALNVTDSVAAQVAAQASAKSYPTKPVRLIVPLAPGGGSDIVARIVDADLSGVWGQSVVVDNRSGAGSTVGTAIAAKTASDGYTLLVSSSSLAISPALYKKLDFDVRRDFSAITLIASQPSILAVHTAPRNARRWRPRFQRWPRAASRVSSIRRGTPCWRPREPHGP